MIRDEKLADYYGGAFSASLLNSIVRGVYYLLELGRSLGSALRRGITGRMCNL